MPPIKASFPQDFQVWLENWGPKLWEILVYFHSSSDEVHEEFKEALRATYFRNQLKKKKPNTLGLSRSFIRTWSKYVARRSTADLKEWRNATLLLSLFRQSMHPSELAYILDKSPSHVLMRAFDLFLANLDSQRVKAISADCVRSDLHFVEAMLSLPWKDPLKLFGPEAFQGHLESCERCQFLKRHFLQKANELKQWVPPPIPQQLFAELEIDEKTASGWFAKNLFTRWPWYIKVPVQVSAAALIVLLVMAVPFGGNLFPKKKVPRESPVAMESAEPDPVAVAPAPEVESPPVTLAKTIEPDTKKSPEVAANAKVVIPPPSPPEVKKIPAPPVPPKAPEADAKVAAAGVDLKQEKLFWRWGAFTNLLDEDKNRILAILTRYHAEQAGELALGAPYQGGRYFHFSIKKEDFETVQSEITALKLENFSKEQGVSPRRTSVDLRRIVFVLKPSRTGP